ncbi:MAG: hypothetical protein R3C46_16845 [Hyphomonadaceae bacterium]
MIDKKMTRGVSAGALAALLTACGHLPIAEPAFEAMSDKRAGLPTDWTVAKMTGDPAAIIADYSVFQDAQLMHSCRKRSRTTAACALRDRECPPVGNGPATGSVPPAAASRRIGRRVDVSADG